jgi:oligoendopeptidase F
MTGFRWPAVLLAAALVVPTLGHAEGDSPAAPARERSQVPERYKWDLSALYPNDAAWAAAKKQFDLDVPQLAQYQGKLGESSATLAAVMTTVEKLGMQADRIYVYGSQRYDEDTRVSSTMSMQQGAIQAYTDLQAATSWIRPEVLAVGKPTIDKYIAEQPKLQEYRLYFDDILRAAPHTRTASEEKIIAQSGAIAQTGATVHSVFTNAELPFPTVTLANGDKVRIDASAYEKYRASTNKADRDAVFDAFWTTYGSFTRTLAATLNSQVQAHVFNRDTHLFKTSLEASLFDYNVPTQVYSQLVADVHRNLPTLQRYLKLRQRIMGLDKLGYEDLYAPIVDSVDLEYTPEQAQQITLDAFAPLGKEYVAALKKGYDERWVDFIPTTGKNPGAYSNSSYGVHPYQLLNFNGRYEDLSVLAHESGHSMHTYLSMAHQPYATSNYSTFVAEVASTLNQGMLFHYMLDRTNDDKTRLFLLSSYLDMLRGTLFRQALFAEFELKIHEMVEGGEPLTAESLSKLYLGLVRAYYGQDKGVITIDDKYGAEWAFIPHFYRNFYVYQYATSMVAGMSLLEGIIGDQAKKAGTATKNRDKYITMLSSGSAKYPIDLLKDAGVDMTTSAPFDASMREMNRIMDEIEKIDAKGQNAKGQK